MSSLVADVPISGVGGGGADFFLDNIILNIATTAEEIPAWGTQRKARDMALRRFMTTEPILASALFSTIAKYTAFGWTLVGPPRTAGIVQDRLHQVEKGEGWQIFLSKVLLDLFTQDNGAFIEVVRSDDSERAPVVSLTHLDANRCVRTGNSREPVTYYDALGKGHLLKWYQVICLAEMPSADELARGMQYCVVTRLLKAAQILRDIAQYKYEKIGGHNTRAIHIVSGVTRREIEATVAQQREIATAQGFTRYIQPTIITTVDPTHKPDKVTIELASLPDGFDEEVAMKWYINQLALAFGGDYQDYAPLPGGNLGSAQQSNVLHLKARGKGPALFMRTIEQKFNFHGIMPQTVRFRFGEQDLVEDREHAEIRLLRAQERAARLASGEINGAVARQMALDAGDLDEAYLHMMEESNATDTIRLGSGT
jgi:hypothetical protein